MVNKEVSGVTVGRRRRFVLSRRGRIVGAVMALGLAVGLPSLVGAVQNIFTGFGQITDIQFEGSNIDQVVYRGTVLWERAPEEAQTGDYMQTVTIENCPTGRTRVNDARDNASYWVQKLADGKCWMLTNLAYAGGGNNAYGDTTADIPNGVLMENWSYTEPAYYIPPGSNRTVGTTDPSTSVDGGVTNPQYGYLYNFCAAMNSQPVACTNTNASQPDQSANPGNNTVYNVCPAGWRLPTGEELTGDFTALNTAINGGSITSPSGLLNNGIYMYSGAWYGDGRGFTNQGANGYYWSSTVYNATNPRMLYFYGTHVSPAGGNTKRAGFAVRCVAD